MYSLQIFFCARRRCQISEDGQAGAALTAAAASGGANRYVSDVTKHYLWPTFR